MQFSIGEVHFRRKGVDWQHQPSGKERVELLRLFYHRNGDLNGFTPYVVDYGAVTWEDVNWSTAGASITS